MSASLTLAQVAVGSGTACGLTSDGAAYCWGLNSSGQLGDPDTAVNFSVPVAVLSQPSTVAAGYGHSCLLRDGKAACAGDDTYGELGDNTTTAGFLTLTAPASLSRAVTGSGKDQAATCAGSCTLPTDSTIHPVAITTATSTPIAYTVYDTSAGP